MHTVNKDLRLIFSIYSLSMCLRVFFIINMLMMDGIDYNSDLMKV